MRHNIWLSWSSGKDCAWALYILKMQGIEVSALFSTVNEKYQRVAMHGTRLDVLKAQAKSIGLPLEIIYLPDQCTNQEYEEIMNDFVYDVKDDGIDMFAFGDIHLQDVRLYREKHLEKAGLKSIFPIWGESSKLLSSTMINGGLKAKISCLNPNKVHKDLIGSEYDFEFLNRLDGSVDLCGEHGEFHSVTYDGPMFRYPLKLKQGKVVGRGGFVFTDILLSDS